MIANDTDLLVDLEIPADAIQLGHDKDGLPKTDPSDKIKAEAREPKKAKEPKPDAGAEEKKRHDADLADARRRAFEAQVERDRHVKLAEQERTARLQAEEKADTRTGQAIRAHYERIASHHQQLTGAAQAAQSEAAIAQREYVAAMEAQDWNKAGEAQTNIAKAQAVLMQLEASRGGIEAQLDEAKSAMQAMQRAMAQQGETDKKTPVKDKEQPAQPTPEEWIAQFPRTTQDWLTSHKDFVTDAKMHRKLLRFADDWVDDHGQETLHSAGFISALNEKFFPQPEEAAEDEEGDEEVDVAEPVVAKATTKSAPAAPVSRSNGGSLGKSSGNGKVRLSAMQQDAAYKMYPSLQPKDAILRYAKNLDRLAKDGISLQTPQQ